MPGLGFLKLQKNPLRSIPTGGIFISSPRVNLISTKRVTFSRRQGAICTDFSKGICPATAVNEKTLAGLLDKPMAAPRPDYETIVADPVKTQPTRAAVFTGAFTAAFS